jgi:hypothetical protein
MVSVGTRIFLLVLAAMCLTAGAFQLTVAHAGNWTGKAVGKGSLKERDLSLCFPNFSSLRPHFWRSSGHPDGSRTHYTGPRGRAKGQNESGTAAKKVKKKSFHFFFVC